jgi:hypothetical protein
VELVECPRNPIDFHHHGALASTGILTPSSSSSPPLF